MKISVIIPTYNRPKKLEIAIKSVFNQTIKPKEIIVVDDGSDKKIPPAITASKKIIYISSTHSGLPAVNRNIGIKKATGDWIAFLDDDDSWVKNKLERQLITIKQQQADLVCSNAWKIRLGLKKSKYFDNRKSENIIFPAIFNHAS